MTAGPVGTAEEDRLASEIQSTPTFDVSEFLECPKLTGSVVGDLLYVILKTPSEWLTNLTRKLMEAQTSPKYISVPNYFKETTLALRLFWVGKLNVPITNSFRLMGMSVSSF